MRKIINSKLVICVVQITGNIFTAVRCKYFSAFFKSGKSVIFVLKKRFSEKKRCLLKDLDTGTTYYTAPLYSRHTYAVVHAASKNNIATGTSKRQFNPAGSQSGVCVSAPYLIHLETPLLYLVHSCQHTTSLETESKARWWYRELEIYEHLWMVLGHAKVWLVCWTVCKIIPF